jgi:hypothetical protein
MISPMVPQKWRSNPSKTYLLTVNSQGALSSKMVIQVPQMVSHRDPYLIVPQKLK